MVEQLHNFKMYLITKNRLQEKKTWFQVELLDFLASCQRWPDTQTQTDKRTSRLSYIRKEKYRPATTALYVGGTIPNFFLPWCFWMPYAIRKLKIFFSTKFLHFTPATRGLKNCKKNPIISQK